MNIIKEIGDFLTKIKRAGDGIGIHIMDRELEKMMVTQTLVDMNTLVSNWKHTVDGELLGKQVKWDRGMHMVIIISSGGDCQGDH